MSASLTLALALAVPPMAVDGIADASVGPAVMDSTMIQSRAGFGVTLEGEDFRGSFAGNAGYLGPMPTPRFDNPDALDGITHLITAGPQIRLGAVNNVAWGYGVLAGGYARRIDRPRCVASEDCPTQLAANGAFFSMGIGGMVPVRSHLWMGAEARLDHSFALDGALWTQTYVLEFSMAFSFVGDGDRVRNKPTAPSLAGRRPRRRRG